MKYYFVDIKTFIGCMLGIFFLACQPTVQNQDLSDPILAEVYDYQLPLSSILELLEKTTSKEDSLMRLRILVNAWVREKLMLHNAEDIVPKDLNIDQLVNDYRSSLLVHNYERILVEDQVDTMVSQQELLDYYNKNKDQYQLESTIIRCHFIKTTQDQPKKDSLEKWWKKPDQSSFSKLIKYCNDYAELFMLDDNTWYKVEEITQLLPAGSLSESSMRAGRNYQFSDEQYDYYLRIHEAVKNKEIAPLSYIEGQATRYIMHQRKLTLLEKIKNDLYQEGLTSRFVKINIE